MSAETVTCTVDHLDDTAALAQALAAALEPPLIISLVGPLGAGKTQLIRCLAAAWDIDSQSVVSPTFSLCQTYSGKFQVHHLDVYRIQSVEEFLDLGVDELFEEHAITMVEWGDRVAEALPDDYLEIRIDTLDIDRRRLQFTCHGELAEKLQPRLTLAISQFG